MATVRTDTTLIGSCDGLPCWIVVSDSYPPATANVYILSYNTSNQHTFFQPININSTSSITFAKDIIPILAVPTFISISGTNVTMSVQCYNATNRTYIGNLFPQGGFGLSPYNTRTMVFGTQIPSTYNTPSIVSSVPYVANLGPVLPGSSSTSVHLFFVTRLSFNSDCAPFSDDLTSLINSDGSYNYPTQVKSLLESMIGSGADSSYNGYTTLDTCQKFSSIGMIFYSDGSCGDSVSFQGIDNTTQSSSTSYGPCDNSSCSYNRSGFSCGSSGDNNQHTNSVMTVSVIVGIVLLVGIVIVIVIAVNKNRKSND